MCPETTRRLLYINHLCTYDLHDPVRNAYDAGSIYSITWASGRGLGPGNLDFLLPQMALAYRLDAISQGPKKSRFPGPNPIPLALITKNITHRAIKIIGA
jgi:hypothetical protein